MICALWHSKCLVPLKWTSLPFFCPTLCSVYINCNKQYILWYLFRFKQTHIAFESAIKTSFFQSKVFFIKILLKIFWELKLNKTNHEASIVNWIYILWYTFTIQKLSKSLFLRSLKVIHLELLTQNISKTCALLQELSEEKFKATIWNGLIKSFNRLVHHRRERKHVYPTQHIWPPFVIAAGKSVDVVGFLKTQNDLRSHVRPLPYIDMSIKQNVLFWIF